MVKWLFTMLDVARVRNATVATIQPLVEASRCRLDGIPDSIWSEPYMIGLMGMLITLTAERQTSSVEGIAMRRVQTEAWRRITGLDYQIGEEIMLLSATHDEQFLEGCMDAARIASELHDCETPFPLGWNVSELSDTSLLADPLSSRHVSDIARWRETFDSYIAHRR